MCIVYKMHCFFTLASSSPATGLLSSSQRRGTQGARVYTSVHDWAPAGFRGACSGRPKSWLFSGDHVPPSRAKQGKGNPTISDFGFAAATLYNICVTLSLKPFSPRLCDSHGTTAVAQQALPFVTATDGVSVFASVPCFLSSFVGNRNQHAVQIIIGCCAACNTR